jgi:ParB family transcriptional regulator, chromosome partitioning protein
MTEKRRALGKGLSALIPEMPAPREAPLEVDIDLLSPNPYQPRRHQRDAALDDLSRSIKAHGLIQPIIVRRVEGRYEIVAGERRWRAAQQAGLLRVPVVVREVAPGDEQKLLEVALIENIQREDLNAIDEAGAYRRLMDQFRLKQEDIAAAVGKDRSSVANILRLLRLPEDIRQQVAAGTLSMGHARALLALDDERTLRRVARDVVARSLSVRQTESLVKRQTKAGSGPRRPAAKADVHTRAAEDRLRVALGTRVRIVHRGQGGQIEIDFRDETELQRLYEQLARG